jgi:hypothetical protein
LFFVVPSFVFCCSVFSFLLFRLLFLLFPSFFTLASFRPNFVIPFHYTSLFIH